ncbi:MAG: PEP-CTERM sorting domain-containing protein [Planctomycetota bacterium]
MNHRLSVRVAAVTLAAIAGGAASADVLSVSFVGDLTQYFGPASQGPFNPTTPLGSAIAANADLGRFDGQFIVNNFDPTIPGVQTFTFGPGAGASPDVEFFLHTPILERVEAFTTRLADGNAQGVSENTKILLPRRVDSTTTDELGVTTTGFFGVGTLTVVDGVPTSISYNQGANTLNSFDFRFNPLSLEDLTVQGDGTFTNTGTFNIDNGEADVAPYGFNTPLSAFPGSTILDTTVGDVRAELALGTILDGRASSGGMPIADPFANFSGTWYQYQAGGVNAAVTVVPAPASAALIGLGGLAMSRRRR